MTAIHLAAAQSLSRPADVAANVREHLRFMAAAHEAGVMLLLFPELSLCGYELPMIHRCVVQPDDEALVPIRKMAGQTGMTVTLGAPLANGSALPTIGAITFLPDGNHTVYRKQYLHPGEDRHASAGPPGSHVQGLWSETVAHAICADASYPQHGAQAAAAGASLYLAGVLVSESGYAKDADQMKNHARDHGMGVLMANHGGPSGGYLSAGKSAFWAPGGALVVAAPGAGPCLVMASKTAGAEVARWRGAVLPL